MAQINALPFNNLNGKEFSLLLYEQQSSLVHFDHDHLSHFVFHPLTINQGTVVRSMVTAKPLVKRYRTLYVSMVVNAGFYFLFIYYILQHYHKFTFNE